MSRQSALLEKKRKSQELNVTVTAHVMNEAKTKANSALYIIYEIKAISSLKQSYSQPGKLFLYF